MDASMDLSLENMHSNRKMFTVVIVFLLIQQLQRPRTVHEIALVTSHLIILSFARNKIKALR